MPDFLDTLAKDAQQTVQSGYYQQAPNSPTKVSASLKTAVLQSKAAAVITEVKGASPSAGTIRKDFAPAQIAKAMQKGGAAGISVLTEPKHFNGSLQYLVEVRGAVGLPLLMKDFVVDSVQLDAAVQVGANVVLLIQALFDRGYCSCSRDEMIEQAHRRGLEVLLEAHTADEFRYAVDSEADLVGINNRNLATLGVDLETTRRILAENDVAGKVVVSESGVHAASDVAFLFGCGAKGFLVGSAIMLSTNITDKVNELVCAIEGC
ncbi:MAG: indole-3-glycerol-phosphate synthase [Candidatus Bathyarchaeota archaeon]|nr:indole-3-glycerol-phosphate synthase [Candidatus Bathyarchaeota archaeon]